MRILRTRRRHWPEPAGLVGQKQQDGGDNQADSDGEQILTEQALHLVLEEQAHDGDRNHGYANLQDIISLIIIFELEKSFQKFPNRAPEYYDGT